ncbi:MAG: DNA polymerase IV [Candidatus Omnitrophota bacterium]|nr:DNA polymerase IV [Candidatus Omnitrophota bacterium]
MVKTKRKAAGRVTWPRKIIHIDMDAFYAAIEQRDHPDYRGKPVVVGGDPRNRGVVSTASYEARKYGIHSAMPAATAKRLCPQAIFLRPRFEAYRCASRQIMSILRQHTELVEPVSLDEAYLDVTKHKLHIDNPVIVASLIKQNIAAVTHLTASAGVAPNLFLAKIASDFQKPDGLTVIPPDAVQAFLKDLPVRKIPGVGPVTEKGLLAKGIKTCGDLATLDSAWLTRTFGKTGLFLYHRALGVDEREVEPHTERKQYSAEETFEKDVLDTEWLKSQLRVYAEEIYEGLKKSGRMGNTLVLKVKYHDFEQITRSKTFARRPENWQEIYRIACLLLETKTLAGRKPIRLLGVGMSGLRPLAEAAKVETGDLFDGVL